MTLPPIKPMPDHLPGVDYIPFGVVWKNNQWVTLKWHSPDSEAARRDGGHVFSKSLAMFAPTRSGKLTTQIGMTLASYNYGSMVMPDLKGEGAWYSIPARRAMGQECHTLNPFGLHTEGADYMRTSCINPLAECDPAADDYTERLDALAHDTIRQEQGRNEFFSEGATNIWQAAMDALRRIRPDASIPDAAELVSAQHWPTALSLFADSSSSAAREVAAIYDPANKDQTDGSAGQLQTLRSQTRIYYEIEPIKRMLSGKPDFSWRDLKKKDMSIFIVLPERAAERYSGLTRLLLSSCMAACMSYPKRPVFMLLDELAHVFGHKPLSLFPQAFNLGAGFGFRLQAVFQNFGQAITMFGREGAQSLMSGAGAVQFFTPGVEMETPKLLAEFAGQTSKLKIDPMNPERREWVSVPVWYPQDIRGYTHYKLPDGSTRPDVRWQCIVKEGEALPIVAGRMSYWNPHWQDFYTARLQDRLDA